MTPAELPLTEDVPLSSGAHRVTWFCPEHPDAGTTSVAGSRDRAIATATKYWVGHRRAVNHGGA